MAKITYKAKDKIIHDCRSEIREVEKEAKKRLLRFTVIQCSCEREYILLLHNFTYYCDSYHWQGRCWFKYNRFRKFLYRRIVEEVVTS